MRTPRAPPEGEAPVPSPLWRPWRYAAGIAFGAAVAVKWSGGLGIIAAIVISLVWETSRRHRSGTTHGAAFARALFRESFTLLIALVILPFLLHVAHPSTRSTTAAFGVQRRKQRPQAPLVLDAGRRLDARRHVDRRGLHSFDRLGHVLGPKPAG